MSKAAVELCQAQSRPSEPGASQAWPRPAVPVQGCMLVQAGTGGHRLAPLGAGPLRRRWHTGEWAA